MKLYLPFHFIYLYFLNVPKLGHVFFFITLKLFFWKRLEGIRTALSAEMLAILLGSKLGEERSFQKLLVETDSLVAINLINKGENLVGRRHLGSLYSGYCWFM